MLSTTFGLWVIANYCFLDKYLQAIHEQSSRVEKITVATVILWIVLTSFYASFHMVSFLFSLVITKWGRKAARNYETTPPVAILYTCMNDMKEEAIISCLTQDYPDYSLYVLDDSSSGEERARVDALRDRYGEKVFVIRRENRNGFKAGNLNNALRQISASYEYVCVIDADELIPQTFLREMVAIAEGDKNLGFVQASHHQYGETAYGKQTGDCIDLHWNYFLPARNRFGFVYFYGHGALLRLQALISAGGFPEIVSEDIAVSTKLREVGFRGYFAPDVKSIEETPPSYPAFRRRNRKIMSGTLEFLIRFYPSFLRSSNVSIVEKIDLLIASSVIYLPVGFICFLFILHCVMPLLYYGANSGEFFSIENVDSLYARTTMSLFHSLGTWSFVVFLLFTVFAPLCYLIPNAIRSPKKVILYVLKMGTIHLSICLQTIWVSLTWLVSRRTSFISTGDRVYRASGSFSGALECLIGLMMITVGLVVGSLCLMAVGLSLMLVPILLRNNLNGRLIPVLTILPIFLTMAAICGMPVLTVGVAGMFAGVALAHH